MRTFLRPTSAALAAACLALGAAGCGGSDGGGGNEADYVKTYNTACKTVTDAVAGLQGEAQNLQAQAAKDPNKAIEGFKSLTTKLLDTFGEQIQVMADAKAPDKWSDFQKSLKDSAGKSQDAVTKAKDEVSKIKTIQELSTIGTKLDAIEFGDSKDMPDDLKKAAPSCAALDK
ncbi:hypothetical protein [Patulibacter defluvii]|uniref:hypothetical protein n=1 Tax=Patulibacter defluvii TaxID=3095358 RepID=UPI002A749E24|nr:hypothetical protein [Patulibacter sp. DM4]